MQAAYYLSKWILQLKTLKKNHCQIFWLPVSDISNKNNTKIHCTALIVECIYLIFISRILGIRTFGWLQILNYLFIGLSTSVKQFLSRIWGRVQQFGHSLFHNIILPFRIMHLLRSRVANESLEDEIHVMLTNLNNKPVVFD